MYDINVRLIVVDVTIGFYYNNSALNRAKMTRPTQRVNVKAKLAVKNAVNEKAPSLRQLREQVRAKIQEISVSEKIPQSDPKSQLLRPLLAAIIARELDLPLAHKNFAMAMTASQVIHEASLYHDDVIDEGKYRRGRPTFPSQVGNRIAVMQGDRFIAAAFKLIAESETPLLMKDFVYTIEKIIGGEVLQNSKIGKILPWQRYEQINRMKTGELFAFAARIPFYFIPASTSNKRIEVLSSLGLQIGTMYQYIDDFFDYNLFSNSGKPPYQDFKGNKWTLISHFVKNFSWNETLTEFWKNNYRLAWDSQSSKKNQTKIKNVAAPNKRLKQKTVSSMSSPHNAKWEQLTLHSPLQVAAKFLINELTALQVRIDKEFNSPKYLLELIDHWKVKISQAQAAEIERCIAALKEQARSMSIQKTSKSNTRSLDEVKIPHLTTLHKFLYAFLERTFRAKEQAAAIVK
ncbi:hypothetical protein COTS27_01530 [Spirochaetota bacterium]|nr:hypothetical protein COTS27_01530 [Spirochaetota bacterium]